MANVVGALANEIAILTTAKADPSAFAAVYDHYFSSIYNYVRYRVPDAAQAEDLTAQVFERVLANLGSFDHHQAAFAVWLFTVARNLVTDYLRAQKRRNWFSLEQVSEQAQPSPLPEEQVIHGEMQDALLAALSLLGDRERDLLALKFVAQMTNRRIAELTGLSESNVGVILHRALGRLRSELQEKDEA